MNIPVDLQYTKSHEWVKTTQEGVEIGLTDYAQDNLGDIVFVNFPEAGDNVVAGEPFGDVESVKAVSDIYSPVTGVVAQVNEILIDAPQTINEDPYEAWFIRVEELSGREDLMSAEEYAAFVESES